MPGQTKDWMIEVCYFILLQNLLPLTSVTCFFENDLTGHITILHHSGMGGGDQIHSRQIRNIIEMDDGKIYRKPLYLMVKTMVYG